MRRDLGVYNASLMTLPCDAGEKTHGLYTSCGFVGNKETAMTDGEWYLFDNFPSDIEQKILKSKSWWERDAKKFLLRWI